MQTGALIRLRLAGLAAATAAVALLLVAAAPPAGSRGAPAELLPDLVVKRPGEIYLTRGPKATRLRLSSTTANIGTGPLEIFSDGSLPCDRNGAASEGRLAYQRVFRDAEPHDGVFQRQATDGAPADTEFAESQAGCTRYHPAHDHWHFDGFALYTLWREDTAAPAGRAKKVSFCVLDTEQPHPELAGSPSDRLYPFEPGGPAALTSCSATTTDGLSVGWADTYAARLPGQAIKLTDPRRGSYCLRLEADPDNRLGERREGNNRRTVRLLLKPKRKRVKRLPGPCATAPSA